jgi:hypothetical protein
MGVAGVASSPQNLILNNKKITKKECLRFLCLLA